MKIYLAHPFDARKDIKIWQDRTKIEGIEFVNPFYDLTRSDIKTIDRDGVTREQIESGQYVADPDIIVPTDIQAITECEAVMAYWSGHKSIGMPMEMVYAFTLGLDVHSVCLDSMYHPWIQYHSDTIFSNLVEYKQFLETKYVDKEAGTGTPLSI